MFVQESCKLYDYCWNLHKLCIAKLRELYDVSLIKSCRYPVNSHSMHVDMSWAYEHSTASTACGLTFSVYLHFVYVLYMAANSYEIIRKKPPKITQSHDWYETCLWRQIWPHSAVGNVPGYTYVCDCWSRGRKLDPGPVPYFRGDWTRNSF